MPVLEIFRYLASRFTDDLKCSDDSVLVQSAFHVSVLKLKPFANVTASRADKRMSSK